MISYYTKAMLAIIAIGIGLITSIPSGAFVGQVANAIELSANLTNTTGTEGNMTISDTSNMTIGPGAANNTAGNISGLGGLITKGPIIFKVGCPRTANSGDEKVATGHVQAKVTCSESGRVDTIAHVWTNNAAVGFTGGFFALFADKDGNYVGNTPARSIGVNADPLGSLGGGGGSDKTRNYVDNIGQQNAEKVQKIEVYVFHAPGDTIKKVNQALEETEKIGKKVLAIAAIIAAIIALF
jgi:hypothetical protein